MPRAVASSRFGFALLGVALLLRLSVLFRVRARGSSAVSRRGGLLSMCSQ
ncbi:hypothetical protein [Burkholderia contaminans]|nr:hypothetical protein [Burkholderia contaminans]